MCVCEALKLSGSETRRYATCQRTYRRNTVCRCIAAEREACGGCGRQPAVGSGASPSAPGCFGRPCWRLRAPGGCEGTGSSFARAPGLVLQRGGGGRLERSAVPGGERKHCSGQLRVAQRALVAPGGFWHHGVAHQGAALQHGFRSDSARDCARCLARAVCKLSDRVWPDIQSPSILSESVSASHTGHVARNVDGGVCARDWDTREVCKHSVIPLFALCLCTPVAGTSLLIRRCDPLCAAKLDQSRAQAGMYM